MAIVGRVYFDNSSNIGMIMGYESEEARATMMLAALGNETRLRIFRLLVRAGEAGLKVGDVQSRLDLAGSTLTHHLATLRLAGLIAQRRDGRAIVCSAEYEAMDALVVYLTDQCCVDAVDTQLSDPA